MDPNATLEEIRWALDFVDNNPVSEEFQELADSVRSLDEWLSKGGFLPQDWRRP